MGYAEYYEIKNGEELRLLQSSMAKLSTFKSNEGKIKFMTNCSFYSWNGYVTGRDQGDERDDKPPLTNFNGFHLVVFKDQSYKIGNFDSWEYTKEQGVVAGFSPCALFRNGKYEINPPLADKWVPKSRYNRTAIGYNGHWILSACHDMTADEYNEDFWNKFKPHFVAFLDSSKSSEAIDKNGKFVIEPVNGEQAMLNGLAAIELKDTPTPEPEPIKDIILRYPCVEGWGSQGYHSGHKGLDIGWLGSQSKDGHTPIQACADGIVEFEGIYPETFKDGKTYYPIGVIIRHPQFSNDYDLISIYWHLTNTIIDKDMRVKEGQQIGTKGSTGNTGNPPGVHLHFQLLVVSKGAAIPKSCAWADISIDPTNLLRVHKDQIFDENKSAFILKKYEEPEPEPSGEIEKLKKEIEELKKEKAELVQENIAIRDERDTLELKLSDVKQDLQKTIERIEK